jgi:hypothetical protein
MHGHLQRATVDYVSILSDGEDPDGEDQHANNRGSLTINSHFLCDKIARTIFFLNA